LRNHDELTLEMVADEDRDYMWGEYAKDPRMKANIGIRRRLAPLLDNDIDRMELFTALLLSLPGSPVLYYGDEIGMGDNIWLEDRDAVRTPMQWTSAGGFSTSSTTYYPMNDDPLHGPPVRNVEDQLCEDGSLLRRTREALVARKRHPALATGRYVELSCDSPAVLAFLRVLGDEAVLCVNNLSDAPIPATVDLGEWSVRTPVSLQGQAFPVGDDGRLAISLEGHGVLWLSLAPVVVGGDTLPAPHPEVADA
jgi:maltose alpha-D-glucosyltransferase/alpha-amylase